VKFSVSNFVSRTNVTVLLSRIDVIIISEITKRIIELIQLQEIETTARS